MATSIFDWAITQARKEHPSIDWVLSHYPYGYTGEFATICAPGFDTIIISLDDTNQDEPKRAKWLTKELQNIININNLNRAFKVA